MRPPRAWGFASRELRHPGSPNTVLLGEEPGNRNRILSLPFIAPVIFSKALHGSLSVFSSVCTISSSCEEMNERLLRKLWGTRWIHPWAVVPSFIDHYWEHTYIKVCLVPVTVLFLSPPLETLQFKEVLDICSYILNWPGPSFSSHWLLRKTSDTTARAEL